MAKRDQPEKPRTKKFGRFEFKAKEPAEIYEGDRMELEHGYVKILNGQDGILGFAEDSGSVVAVVHLDKGQSVREITEIRRVDK
jgi:hypothetical protein